jgi:membrane protease YdiL (CAAX protease family)
MRSFVSAHPLATYLFLAFALSWWPWPLQLLNPNSAPTLPWGPLVGALVVTWAAWGRAGLGRLLRATFKWRVHPTWYVVALAGPILLWGLPALVAVILGHSPDMTLLGDFYLWPLTVVLFGIVQGPLTEEPGWRGVALPLMLRRWSPLLSSILLGGIWFLWHAPLLLGPQAGQRPLLPYLISIIALSVFLTAIVIGTRGSVFIAILFHAAINATASHVVPSFAEPARDLVFWMYALLSVVAAAAVAFLPWFRKPRLEEIEAAPYERSDPTLGGAPGGLTASG